MHKHNELPDVGSSSTSGHRIGWRPCRLSAKIRHIAPVTSRPPVSNGWLMRIREGSMFDGFETRLMTLESTTIFAKIAGSGPPLLLLHGFPETHLMWRDIAPALSEQFSVVCADLRGYGQSGTPSSEPDHGPYTKRVMADDMVGLMK